jgi:hypothetical protein
MRKLNRREFFRQGALAASRTESELFPVRAEEM